MTESTESKRYIATYWQYSNLDFWQVSQANCERNIDMSRERYGAEKFEDTRQRYDDHDYLYDGVD